MGETPILARIVASSLKRTPPQAQQSLLRKILLPGPWLTQRLYGGVWIAGDVLLTPDALVFAPNKMSARLRREPLDWTIPLAGISAVDYKASVLIETVDIHHAGGIQTFKCARAAEFMQQLETARQAAAS